MINHNDISRIIGRMRWGIFREVNDQFEDNLWFIAEGLEISPYLLNYKQLVLKEYIDELVPH